MSVSQGVESDSGRMPPKFEYVQWAACLHTGEAYRSRLVYSVSPEQEELLMSGLVAGMFFRGSVSWITALKRFNQTFGV